MYNTFRRHSPLSIVNFYRKLCQAQVLSEKCWKNVMVFAQTKDIRYYLVFIWFILAAFQVPWCRGWMSLPWSWSVWSVAGLGSVWKCLESGRCEPVGGRAVGHKTLYQFVDIVDMISPIAAPSLDTFGNKTLAVTRLDGRDTILGFINCYILCWISVFVQLEHVSVRRWIKIAFVRITINLVHYTKMQCWCCQLLHDWNTTNQNQIQT